METQTKPRTLEPNVTLDGIGAMIEDRKQYEQAIALCLLSIARSQERIADAAETLASVVDRAGTPNVRTDWFSSAV